MRRGCLHCGSADLTLEPQTGMFGCGACGAFTSQMAYDPETADFFCRECRQPLTTNERGETVHEGGQDLVRPRCSALRAERVRERRAQMRAVS